ncbi:MAG: energy transducer TonB [Neisseria sp.]|nr:energy transducer TonB [Neisseria sp.]
MKPYITAFILSSGFLPGSTAFAQDIETLSQRRVIEERVEIMPAPKAADGREITGMASAFLAVNAAGQVTDVLWEKAGIQELDQLARAQKLPSKLKPVQRCDAATKICEKLPSYQKISFVFPADQISKLPRPKLAIRPVYPPLALENGESGRVELAMVIDAAGVVRVATVSQSSGSRRLDNSARQAAKAARFYPAEYQGKPVLAMASQTLTFKLEDKPQATPGRNSP